MFVAAALGDDWPFAVPRTTGVDAVAVEFELVVP